MFSYYSKILNSQIADKFQAFHHEIFMNDIISLENNERFWKLIIRNRIDNADAAQVQSDMTMRKGKQLNKLVASVPKRCRHTNHASLCT